MIHQQQFIDAVKESGVKSVAVIDDAFDPPAVGLVNAGQYLDFLENADSVSVLVGIGISNEQIDAARTAIAESDYEADGLLKVIAGMYAKYVEDLDERLDPGGMFSADKASNLAYVRPLLALLKKCDPPLQIAIIGSDGDGIDAISDETDLIFLDFYLNRAIAADQEGTSAQKRDGRAASLEKIKALVGKRADRAPSIVLMSSHSDVARQAESFRKDIGGGLVYASRFVHLEKKHLRFNEKDVEIEADAADALLDIVQTYEFGRALDLAFECWLVGAKKAVDTLRGDIEHLNLKELAYLIRFRLAAEGQGLLEYMEWFFGECLLDDIGHAFDAGVGKDNRIKSVEGAAAARIEGAFDGPTKKVAELYHKVRIQSPRPDHHPNYKLGDLYLVSDGNKKRIAAIVTPDCDLIKRPDGKRRAPRLLTVGGTYKAYDAADVTVSDFIMIGNKACNVSWDFKEVVSRSFDDWPEPGQSKESVVYLGTLRSQYAQALQRSVLDDLGRIGLAVAPALGMSAAASIHVRKKSGEASVVTLQGLPKAFAYLVPGRSISDKPKVVFIRRFVTALLDELVKLNIADYPMVAQLKKAEAYTKLKKMFQGGSRLEDSVDFGISVTAKNKPPIDIWCWIHVSLADIAD
ncbi:hypothetical protein [Mesorhizobium sp.]|uniref:hypothetical protein n=1 Tax=Mesorhizobium sp. TaxID=1871066 RepID=UPI00257CEBCC|nr:hypothetical protein [Mesorhizobium sp.]